MTLKKLSSLLNFDNREFFENKTFLLFGIEDWQEFKTKKVLGAKYKVVIFEDNTNYGGDMSVSNAGESLTVKVEGVKAVAYDGRARKVRLINPQATIYGEFRNELSVKADAVEFIDAES